MSVVLAVVGFVLLIFFLKATSETAQIAEDVKEIKEMLSGQSRVNGDNPLNK